MSLPVTLVYDRTAADVSEAVRLTSTPYNSLSADDKKKLTGQLKGAYNTVDMTRVNSAVEYLSETLAGYGYDVPVVSATWSVSQIPSVAQLTQYLDNVKNLREAIAVLPNTPNLPDSMASLNYGGANAIEKTLADIDALITKMSATFRHCGVPSCGTTGGLMR